MSTPNPGVCVIDEELEEIVGSLASHVAVSTNDDHSTLDPETLAQFTKDVIDLGNIAGRKGVDGLQEVCTLLQR